MGISPTGVAAFDLAVAKLEAAHQAAIAGVVSQATAITADVTFYTGCIAQAVANGLNPQQYHCALTLANGIPA